MEVRNEAQLCGPLLMMLAAEELSEEDQQLKSELDMLVERLTVGSSTATWWKYADDGSRSPTNHFTNPHWKPSRIPSKPPHLP